MATFFDVIVVFLSLVVSKNYPTYFCQIYLMWRNDFEIKVYWCQDRGMIFHHRMPKNTWQIFELKLTFKKSNKPRNNVKWVSKTSKTIAIASWRSRVSFKYKYFQKFLNNTYKNGCDAFFKVAGTHPTNLLQKIVHKRHFPKQLFSWASLKCCCKGVFRILYETPVSLKEQDIYW